MAGKALPSLINELVKKAVDGDFEAFGELYSMFVNRIYRYIFYQVRNEMLAEDMTEEVFIKAWQAIGSCKGREQSFSSWLYRVAHNHVVDNLRSTKQHLLIGTDITGEQLGDPKQEIGTQLEQGEVFDAISLLPEEQRQVIILKFVEGLSNQEIGQVTGKKQGAIRILQMRGLSRLRGILSSES
ncbi:MAG: sigma-70 family RNA polymerase sigma factor [Chloroflexi bacterium]|nr:sigma-70 family RNA polymerase sigma factor [Chloroflexota bacterium]